MKSGTLGGWVVVVIDLRLLSGYTERYCIGISVEFLGFGLKELV